MLTNAIILAKHPDVATRTVDGRAVAISTASSGQPPTLITFNETGTVIWDLLDGHTSVGRLLERLAAGYPSVPAGQRERETLAILEQLVSAGMLVHQPGVHA